MGKKNLALIIEADQGFLKNTDPTENFQAQNDILFSAITNTYIPLLNMLTRFEEENISFKMGLVLAPAVCTLLHDPQILEQYEAHLDALIELGKREVKRCASTENEQQAKEQLDFIEQTKKDFTEKYSRKLLSKIRHFTHSGYIELIATAATYAYLPHISDMSEALNAQVETGLYSHKHFFGEAGDGFYLPYHGWDKGFEWILRPYGINYTIVDSRALLFSNDCPETGIFAPVRTRNSLVLFASDNETPKDICGDDGYMKNYVYKNQSHDIGFDLSRDNLVPFISKDGARVQTGFKYWANSEEDEFIPYIKEDALEQVKKDAEDFYNKKAEKLEQASKLMGEKDATLVCCIPADLLGQKWSEGLLWLEEVIRIAAEKNEINFALCRDLIDEQFTLPKVNPYPCSSNGLGYGEDLLDSTNCSYIRYMRKATERIIDLTERFPAENSLKERLLNMAAKQVLLSQSGEWQLMIHDEILPDSVKELFKMQILSFTKVFDSLASNTVSTEWLTSVEKKSSIFPWLNYRIFATKK